jgi:hypothetical protein
LSGFLAMVDGMLKPLVEPSDAERDAKAAADAAELVIARVVAHLQCHRDVYVQAYLKYIDDSTGGVSLAAFVRNVLAHLGLSASANALFADAFGNGQTAFLDRDEIVVPAVHDVDLQALVAGAGGTYGPPPATVPPIVEQLDVPFDGFHLEIAPGACVLPDVPVRPEFELGELSVKNVTVAGTPT